MVNENHFTNASNTNRLLFANFFQHRNLLSCIFTFYCIILCLFVEIPKNHDFSQKILIFTYDPKKYKLWVKVCEFALKIVLICFKNVSENCFWDLLQKKSKQKNFKIGQIFVIFWKNLEKTRFFYGFFFDPTHFSAENRQTTKKFRPTTRHIQNPSQKNFGGHSTKIDAKNPKSRPPPFWAKRGGVLLKYDLIYVFYWA